MHTLSSFLAMHIGSLSLALQKHLLWLSLGFTTIVLCPTASPTAVPGLPNRNNKTVAKFTSKHSQIHQKFAKLLQMVQLYQNINFFTGNKSFTSLISCALCFTRKCIGFQHFARIFGKKCSIACFYFHTFNIDVMHFQTISKLKNNKSTYENVCKYVQIFRSYISSNQNIWSQMISKIARNSSNRQTKIFAAKRFQN